MHMTMADTRDWQPEQVQLACAVMRVAALGTGVVDVFWLGTALLQMISKLALVCTRLLHKCFSLHTASQTTAQVSYLSNVLYGLISVHRHAAGGYCAPRGPGAARACGQRRRVGVATLPGQACVPC